MIGWMVTLTLLGLTCLWVLIDFLRLLWFVRKWNNEHVASMQMEINTRESVTAWSAWFILCIIIGSFINIIYG